MTRRFLAVGVLFAAVVTTVSQLPRAVSDDKPAVKLTLPPVAATPASGRFQMTAVGGEVLLLDTATGQVWKRSATGKTDDQFLGPKIKEDAFADWAARVGPTYQSLPLGYWLVMLRDGDKEFREKGVVAVGYFGPKASAALPELVELFMGSVRSTELADNSAELIAWAIAQIDPRHDYLRAQLRHQDYAARRAAAGTIVSLGMIDTTHGPRGVQSNVRTASGDDPEDAEDELVLTCRLPGDREAIPVLIEMLQDREKIARETTFAEAALNGLATFKSEAAAAVPNIRRMLADKDATVRKIATVTLAAIGPAAKGAIPTVRAGLKDPDADVRLASVQALGMFGDRDSIPAIKALMADEDTTVRQGVVRSLGFFKDDAGAVVPVLLEVVRTPQTKLVKPTKPGSEPKPAEASPQEDYVVKEAYRALGKLGPAAKLAVPELINQARASNDRLAPEAHWALRKIAPDEAKKIPVPKPVGPVISPASYPR